MNVLVVGGTGTIGSAVVDALSEQHDVTGAGHTSGVLSQEPTPGSAAISLVNAGVEGFVRAAALDLPREIRINVVSPPWVAETLEAMGENPEQGLPAATVAEAYRKSLDGEMTGETIDARSVAQSDSPSHAGTVVGDRPVLIESELMGPTQNLQRHRIFLGVV